MISAGSRLLLLLLMGLMILSCKKDDDKNDPQPQPATKVVSFTYTQDELTVSFVAVTSEQADSVTWEFGDGNAGKGLTTNNAYSQAGSFAVTATAHFGSEKKTATQTIELSSTASASINSEQISVNEYKFTGTVTGATATRYVWDFGDGKIDSSTSATINHVFGKTGAFEVKLTVRTSRTSLSADTNITITELGFELVELTTTKGSMTIWLHPGTPKHRTNFLKLAGEGYYDGTTFHRVIPDFMNQGGDPNSKDSNPNNDGQGGPGYTIPAEIKPELRHIRGAVASARLGDNVNPQRNSSGSQFYIVANDNGAAHLNGQYTVFGQVIGGIETNDAINSVPRGAGDRPLDDVTMQAKIVRYTRAELQELFSFTP